jgi:hypothetical protein
VANMLTPQEVADQSGLSVNAADIALAQAVIQAESGADLGLGASAPYSVEDLGRLRRAVLWQVVYLQAHPEAVNAQPNIAGFSGSGAGINFFEGQNGTLAPLAAKELARLSWRAGPVSVQTMRPTRTRYEVMPDQWRRAF